MPSKLYLSFGSGSFIEKIMERDSNIRAASGAGEALLFIETDGKSPFQSGHGYDVLEARGVFGDEGDIVYWSVPAERNGGDLFVHHVMSDPKLIGAETDSFQALRIGRVLKGTDLIVLIQFRDSADASSYLKSVERLTAEQYAEEAGAALSAGPIIKRYHLIHKTN
ncbi:hypothetical protein [Exiguobacterium flavidum]|uniref:hypothetical protein n=1 Tax=Exiguobacterium flavidum TaxID=2184695 RepID=UPI000DF8220D|nr:hypothetical protein [Exiguobacterium flavidum]